MPRKKPQPPVEHQFKPGQSGNPKGRPKGTSLTARLRKALDKNDGELAELLIKVAIREAGKGKFSFFKEIMDRTDGKVAEKHEVLDVSVEASPAAAQQVMREVFGRVTPTTASESDPGADDKPEDEPETDDAA